jgi:hypothetical protein
MVNIQGSIQAENSYSDIRLQNRDYDQADISAETSYNSIHTDKRLNMTVIKEANLQDTAARFGSGSQRIRLKNRHGEIRIELR